MRLNELEAGESAIVIGVDTDESSTLKLMTMGMVEGCVVKCASKLYHSMEIIIYGTRFAISNYTASKFICKKADESMVD